MQSISSLSEKYVFFHQLEDSTVILNIFFLFKGLKGDAMGADKKIAGVAVYTTCERPKNGENI